MNKKLRDCLVVATAAYLTSVAINAGAYNDSKREAERNLRFAQVIVVAPKAEAYWTARKEHIEHDKLNPIGLVPFSFAWREYYTPAEFEQEHPEWKK